MGRKRCHQEYTGRQKVFKMGKIQLNNLNVYSHHGCFDEETKIGSKYQVDVCVEGDFALAEKMICLIKQ